MRPCVAGNTIKLNIDVSKILLGIDLAIPCGLIINELVSNSLKYSFPGDRTGTIIVSMRGEGRDYTLVVSDDGVRMPGDFDYRESGPSGLQLVNTLIGQLEGSISPGEGGGTAVTIKFIDMK